MSFVELTSQDVAQILKTHHTFYHTYQTLPIDFRITQLKKLKDAIKRYETQIHNALRKDLGKHGFESYATETGLVLGSISHTIKHLKKWSKPKKVSTPIHLFPSRSFIMNEPYGTVLIIGPYNYPFQLLIEPLIGAIAAGNCAVLKPSENVPHVAAVITQMLTATFDTAYIRSVLGGVETNISLTHAPFDYIFFTGSVGVGKSVMAAAAKNLVPITLELGGKSPVIIDESANIKVAAKRIMWGKTLNAGQTCVSPDYVLVHESVKDELIAAMKLSLKAFYGEDPQKSPDFGRIVNSNHFNRLQAILTQDKKNIIHGGHTSLENLFIEPTLIDAFSWDAPCMSEELFGPILPIMSYTHLEDALTAIKQRPKPLALYLFTQNQQVKEKVLKEVSFGGGFINDTITHLANPKLPFGGVGQSGMGAYHGEYSFTTFSHQKSIMSKTTKFEIPLIFPPYTPSKLKAIRQFMK
ncbi:MAG: aldehyde dehydrogenase [Cellulosilyticaceae bacterium]